MLGSVLSATATIILVPFVKMCFCSCEHLIRHREPRVLLFLLRCRHAALFVECFGRSDRRREEGQRGIRGMRGMNEYGGRNDTCTGTHAYEYARKHSSCEAHAHTHGGRSCTHTHEAHLPASAHTQAGLTIDASRSSMASRRRRRESGTMFSVSVSISR